MPADGDAPSGGWEAVYASMHVSTDVEAPAPCPDCGNPTVRIDGEGLVCTDHGAFKPAD